MVTIREEDMIHNYKFCQQISKQHTVDKDDQKCCMYKWDGFY